MTTSQASASPDAATTSPDAATTSPDAATTSPAPTAPRARRRYRFDTDAMARLTDMASYGVLFGIRVVADLGVADELIDGPLRVEEIAQRTGAHAPSLHRVLRALACKDVFEELTPGTFALTPMSELLTSDHPMSLRAGLTLIPADVQAWSRFDHSVRTGESSFRYVHGVDYWEHMAAHPDESGRFDRTQQTMTKLEIYAVLRAYDWSATETVVDLGGGNGAFLAGILARNPGLRGVLADLPHVVAGAEEVLRKRGVAQRCEILPGSFFEQMYTGADLYVLKRVVWGHPDETIVGLFTSVRRAMRADGRLLVLEPAIHEDPELEHGKIQDLRLLALGGGGARTPDHIGRLLSEAGMEIERTIPTPVISIIEARAS